MFCLTVLIVIDNKYINKREILFLKVSTYVDYVEMYQIDTVVSVLRLFVGF